jgi:hypothetical protein
MPVETFKYHGHAVEHDAARSDRIYEHWFDAQRDDGAAAFRVVAGVSDIGAHLAKVRAADLAAELGIAQVKGLIDLGYESGRDYRISREGNPPQLDDDHISDDDLYVALLRALRNTRRAEDRTGQIDGLSVDGVAQVLGISQYRLQDGLSDLLTAGLAQEYAATFGHSPLQGAVTISAAGISRLAEHESSAPTRVTAAIMFTDIVSSTEAAAKLGDIGWEVLSHAPVRLFGTMAAGCGNLSATD